MEQNPRPRRRGGATGERKKSRFFMEWQQKYLEIQFRKSTCLDKSRKREMTSDSNLSWRQIKNWFCRRRLAMRFIPNNKHHSLIVTSSFPTSTCTTITVAGTPTNSTQAYEWQVPHQDLGCYHSMMPSEWKKYPTFESQIYSNNCRQQTGQVSSYGTNYKQNLALNASLLVSSTLASERFERDQDVYRYQSVIPLRCYGENSDFGIHSKNGRYPLDQGNPNHPYQNIATMAAPIDDEDRPQTLSARDPFDY